VWEHLRVNPNDDPEARIRALEQPLSDAARTSEMGAGQYPPGNTYPPADTYPPPPQPPPPDYSQWYGGRYGAPPPGTQAFRAWWIVAVAVALGFVVVSAGVAFFTMKARTPGGSVTTTFGGGSSAPRTSTRTVPNHPSTTSGAPATTLAPSGQTAPPGGQVSVSGIDENKTIDCNDGSVSVSGISNTVTITGHCLKVTVSGMSNKVTVDSSDAITASGMENQVTYHSGSPKIENSGGDNTVQQG
jgi:hypothetical protein